MIGVPVSAVLVGAVLVGGGRVPAGRRVPVVVDGAAVRVVAVVGLPAAVGDVVVGAVLIVGVARAVGPVGPVGPVVAVPVAAGGVVPAIAAGPGVTTGPGIMVAPGVGAVPGMAGRTSAGGLTARAGFGGVGGGILIGVVVAKLAIAVLVVEMIRVGPAVGDPGVTSVTHMRSTLVGMDVSCGTAMTGVSAEVVVAPVFPRGRCHPLPIASICPAEEGHYALAAVVLRTRRIPR